MARWYRRFLVLGLFVALAAGVSCSSGESPVEPSVGPSESLVGTLLSTADLLTCRQQPYASASKVIGPDGGTLVVGSHRLVIPPLALQRPVVIKGEQVPGKVNSVRLSPEGLRFARPARLTMSYRNCLTVLLPKRIVYTTEGLQVLRVLPSLDLDDLGTVSSPLDHFSRYVVAY
jgi:hypothetical protein